MPMTVEKSSTPTRLCPTCGTRVSQDANRCLVCGTDLSKNEKTNRPAQAAVQGSRMPTITLSLPATLGFLALFLTIGAVVVYFALQQTGQVAEPTATPTITATTTPTLTPTPQTPTPTSTTLPSPTPITYQVKAGDTCSSIAFNFGVSVQSIALLNNLSISCNSIIPGQTLLIPQPTPTPTPLPTATLGAEEATLAACKTNEYTVQEGDTLTTIAQKLSVSKDVIKKFNGLVNDVVQLGQKLEVPTCDPKFILGPEASTTPPAPYSPPSLLLPEDGKVFAQADEPITLLWAAVGILHENEAYAVTIEDVTSGQTSRVVNYVTDTKITLPATMRPNDTKAHVFRWSVMPVRQTGTDSEGNPLWESAGSPSVARVFIWIGGTSATASP
jgi:LysM repeat protein